MKTFTDSIPLAKAKLLEYLVEDQFVPHSSFSSNPEENIKLEIEPFKENKLYSRNTTDNPKIRQLSDQIVAITGNISNKLL